MSLFSKKKRTEDTDTKHNGITDNHELYNADCSKGPPLPIDKWVDNKLLLCVNPRVADYSHTNYDKQVAIPLNVVFDFESALFKGQCLVRCVDLPNTDKAYFKGRSRKMVMTFQGKFKRRICFDRLYTGQIFDKPFTKLPGHYIIAGGIKLLKTLAPALKADINSTTPHMISPLASAAQIFNVCKPGNETPLPTAPTENVSLLNEKIFKKMKWTDRKAYFHDLSHLKHYYFDTEYIYTMSCYTHMLSPTSYSLHGLGMKWGIHQYIPSPMQISAVVLPVMDKKPVQGSMSGDNSSAESADTGIEIMESEELECESKDEDEEDTNSLVHSDHKDLSTCEFIFNFELWHTKFVYEMYPELKKDRKHSNSHSTGFKSIFGGK